MSICSFRGNLHIQMCRRAFSLASSRRAIIAIRIPAIQIYKRSAHNSLFQMVKKRTLEARTKLQPNSYSSNKLILKNERSSSPSTNTMQSYSSETPASNQTLATKLRSTASIRNASINNAPKLKTEKDVTRQNVSCNADILKALNCVETKPNSSLTGLEIKQETSLTAIKQCDRSVAERNRSNEDCRKPTEPPVDTCNKVPAPCPKESRSVVEGDKSSRGGGGGVGGDGGGGGSGDGGGGRGGGRVGGGAGRVGGGPGRDGGGGDRDGDESCDSGGAGGGFLNKLFGNNWRMVALAAALGLGGLVWYLTRRKSSSQDTTVCKIEIEKQKMKSSDLPKHVPYLLIGGGSAAFSAFRAIKSNDAKAKVLMITDEYRKPYMRPPLSKELWYSAEKGQAKADYRFKQWSGAERSLFFEPDEFFIDPTKLMDNPNGGIAVAHGFTVKKVDPAKRIVTLTDGYQISYDECLLATGCTPKTLPIFEDAPTPVKEKIMVYRTPDDFDKLKAYVDAQKTISIVGNGFVGSELACSLASYKKTKKGGRIFQIFPETGNMSRVLPDYLSKWTTQQVEAQGVCVMANSSITEVKRDNSHIKLTLNTGDTLISDIVVVCVGCEANTNIATLSGLEVDRTMGGFVVNAELEARRNLFVAGDASCFYDPLLGRRRVEHHDHSVVSGRLAGENMVGKKKAYTHQSMFWSDLGPELGYEAIGLVDATLPTVGVFALPAKVNRQTDNLTENPKHIETELNITDSKNPQTELKCKGDSETYGRGVIFYLKDDKIVGVLLWNLFNRIGLARTIISQNKKYDDLNELAKVFDIHS